MIGATTFNEYRRNIEKDAALERRFQPVKVDEPTVEDTISILRGLKERYEVFHGVKITDSALVTAAVLSNRYITDRFLPDKAIDLVDEACAMIKTELDSMPAELDEMNRKIMQMQIEETALKKETDHLSQERLADLQKELAELRDEFNTRKAQWSTEKDAVDNVSKVREQIESTKKEIEAAQRDADYEKAAELQYSKLPGLQKELEIEEDKLKDRDLSLVHENVTDEEIAKIISRWTGIPSAETGRNTAQARDWTGRSSICSFQGCPPWSRGTQRPEASDRFVPVFGTNRCREDGSFQSTGRGCVWQRGIHDPGRYVGVYGKAQCIQNDWLPARICGP